MAGTACAIWSAMGDAAVRADFNGRAAAWAAQASATAEGLLLLEAAGDGAAALLADALKGALPRAGGPLQARQARGAGPRSARSEAGSDRRCLRRARCTALAAAAG